jgi:DnaJ-class molecular chaperone
MKIATFKEWFDLKKYTTHQICKHCDGKGETDNETCSYCKGTGKHITSRHLEKYMREREIDEELMRKYGLLEQ